MSDAQRTIEQLIKDAGGADSIAQAAGDCGLSLTKWAVYKWGANGIPEKCWSVLFELAGTDANEIFAANELIRAQAA